VGPIDTFAFDFDGTLAELTIDFDLLKRKLVALASAFLDEMPLGSGLPALELLDALAEKISQKDAALGREYHSRGRLVITATELEAAEKGMLFDFSRPLLALLKDKGLKRVIITRNSTAAVKTVFPDVLEHCDLFLPREQVRHVKPHPGHLLAALERCGSTPEKTLMVGDHVLDIETGKRAGAYTAAVASGKLGFEDLAKAGPDMISNNCLELVQLAAEKKLI
jgi:phosphoglycolate phosphatase